MFDNNYMHKFIEDICNDIGPRESGTEQEILTGNRVESELKKPTRCPGCNAEIAKQLFK